MTRCLFLLVMAPALYGQSPEAALTQTLITEIHALRQQIEATTVTSQRVQIALYRLQSQTAAVDGAQRRLETARVKVREAESNRRRIAADIQQTEERARAAQNAGERKDLEMAVTRSKAEQETLGEEEAQWQAAAGEAESRLRTEQGRLAELQSLLDRLDRALDEIARPK
jgi:predicted  nucleic acid-binding Zn-ribbon protein